MHTSEDRRRGRASLRLIKWLKAGGLDKRLRKLLNTQRLDCVSLVRQVVATRDVRLDQLHGRRCQHYQRDLPRKLHYRIERQQLITAKELSRVHLVAVRLGFAFIAADAKPHKRCPTLFGIARPHRDDAARFTIQPRFLGQLIECGLIERLVVTWASAHDPGESL